MGVAKKKDVKWSMASRRRFSIENAQISHFLCPLQCFKTSKENSGIQDVQI